MEQASMTALICAFARAYHSEHNEVKIFDDTLARFLLSRKEYDQIAKSLSEGIAFFNPDFQGTPEVALRWIVDQHVSPPPLGRAAFAEQALQRAASIGTSQYCILGAGYDTFAYRQPSWAENLTIFELDHPLTTTDKQMRLKDASIPIPDNLSFLPADVSEEQWHLALTQNRLFDCKQISFCSILGLVYYLSKQTFAELLSSLAAIFPKGSAIVFDYPDENHYSEKAGQRAKKQAVLARAAKEPMLSSYSYHEMEDLLSQHGFLIYEHLTPFDMTQQYFTPYNLKNPEHPMTAFDNVNYCLAVRQ